MRVIGWHYYMSVPAEGKLRLVNAVLETVQNAFRKG